MERSEHVDEIEVAWVEDLSLGAVPALCVPRFGVALVCKPSGRLIEERCAARVRGEGDEWPARRFDLGAR
jgi:hypothetical protein